MSSQLTSAQLDAAMPIVEKAYDDMIDSGRTFVSDSMLEKMKKQLPKPDDFKGDWEDYWDILTKELVKRKGGDDEESLLDYPPLTQAQIDEAMPIMEREFDAEMEKGGSIEDEALISKMRKLLPKPRDYKGEWIDYFGAMTDAMLRKKGFIADPAIKAEVKAKAITEEMSAMAKKEAELKRMKQKDAMPAVTGTSKGSGSAAAAPVKDIVPVSSTDRDGCLQEYTMNKFVQAASGDYGTVFGVCRRGGIGDCRYVIKKQPLEHEVDPRPIALNERKMLTYMNENAPQIVPKLYDSWTCQGNMFMVMERYSMDMWDLGTQQWQRLQKARPQGLPVLTDRVAPGSLGGPSPSGGEPFAFAYTAEQIAQMFAILQVLAGLGIIFGDVAPQQFLVRLSRSGFIEKMVITDFGYAGFINPDKDDEVKSQKPEVGRGGLGCVAGTLDEYQRDLKGKLIVDDNGKPIRHPLYDYRQYLDMWQLFASMTIIPTYVVPTLASLDKSNGEVHFFGGLSDQLLPDKVKQVFIQACPRFYKLLTNLFRPANQKKFLDANIDHWLLEESDITKQMNALSKM